MSTRKIITISRQFGSGGKNIGERLALKLKIPFYDSALIYESAKKTGLNPEIVKDLEESPSNSLLYSLVANSFLGAGSFSPIMELPIIDKIFIAQSKEIRKIAEAGSCVIVGRCGNYILRDDPDLYSIFIHRNLEERIHQVSKINNLSLAKAEELVHKTDKRRKNYYNYYTDEEWSKAENYNLSLDSGMLGEDGCVDLIESFIEKSEIRKKIRG
ncbi:MAG: cytidylate kinase-like family protein [Eubacteriaceae bacterium]|nr:cytidylate kinase-like family protein [Eubacteriaceae bacterium]